MRGAEEPRESDRRMPSHKLKQRRGRKRERKGRIKRNEKLGIKKLLTKLVRVREGWGEEGWEP